MDEFISELLQEITTEAAKDQGEGATNEPSPEFLSLDYLL